MKVLITGGAGYIGYSLVKQILRSHNSVQEILIYDNLSRKNFAFFTHEKFNEKPITFIHGDILDGRNLNKALKGVDTVFHLAAKVTTPFADFDAHAFDQINHWGTAQVVNAIETSDVKHFIYLSSASVYGTVDKAVDETYPPHPQSFYGISKLDGEKQIKPLTTVEKIHIIRSGNVYGYNPSMRIDSVINRFMFNANFSKKLRVQGTGDQKRPFIHIDKLSFVLKELLTKEVPSGTYNVMQHNFSINEIVEEIEKIYHEVESISINHNMRRRSVSIKSPCKIEEYITLPQRNFVDELFDFKVKFAF